MEITVAEKEDLKEIVSLYDAVLTECESGRLSVGWIRGIYPTESTVLSGINAKEFYKMTENGKIVAAARINSTEMPAYGKVDWLYKGEDVLVIHTLAVHPQFLKKGCGTAFIKFYEEKAESTGKSILRLDTNEINATARKVYKSLGYREAGTVKCVFNGIPDVSLVCLEKKIQTKN